MEKAEPHNYVFKRLDKSQLGAIARLYQRAFAVSVSLEELEKKYSTQSFGAAYTGVLAYDANNQPAAYYGVFPCKMSIEGTQVLAAQSGDTMTDPDHRMKGLFVSTAKMAYEIAASEGVEFVFGFPNENSFPGFKNKLGWIFHGHMFNFHLSTSALPLAAFSKKYPKLGRHYLKWAGKRLKKLSIPITPQLIDIFSKKESSGVLKDAAFFDYKITSNTYLIRWKSFELIVKIDGELVIGDVSAFEPSRFPEFMTALKKLGKHLGCHKVLYTATPNDWLYPLFEKAGYPPQQSLPIGFLPLKESPTKFENLRFTRIDYDTF